MKCTLALTVCAVAICLSVATALPCTDYASPANFSVAVGGYLQNTSDTVLCLISGNYDVASLTQAGALPLNIDVPSESPWHMQGPTSGDPAIFEGDNDTPTDQLLVVTSGLVTVERVRFTALNVSASEGQYSGNHGVFETLSGGSGLTLDSCWFSSMLVRRSLFSGFGNIFVSAADVTDVEIVGDVTLYAGAFSSGWFIDSFVTNVYAPDSSCAAIDLSGNSADVHRVYFQAITAYGTTAICGTNIALDVQYVYIENCTSLMTGAEGSAISVVFDSAITNFDHIVVTEVDANGGAAVYLEGDGQDYNYINNLCITGNNAAYGLELCNVNGEAEYNVSICDNSLTADTYCDNAEYSYSNTRNCAARFVYNITRFSCSCDCQKATSGDWCTTGTLGFNEAAATCNVLSTEIISRLGGGGGVVFETESYPTGSGSYYFNDTQTDISDGDSNVTSITTTTSAASATSSPFGSSTVDNGRESSTITTDVTSTSEGGVGTSSLSENNGGGGGNDNSGCAVTPIGSVAAAAVAVVCGVVAA